MTIESTSARERTLTLTHDGVEIARVTGYPGADNFLGIGDKSWKLNHGFAQGKHMLEALAAQLNLIRPGSLRTEADVDAAPVNSEWTTESRLYWYRKDADGSWFFNFTPDDRGWEALHTEKPAALPLHFQRWLA